MQIRRLVKSGLSSFTVALPKDWIDRNKLNKGDFLYIDEKDNKISITTEPKKEKKEKKEFVLHVDGKSAKRIRREIRATYLDDYQTIYIKGTNLRPLIGEIKKDIQDLVSLEAIEESHDKVIARNFLDFTDVSIKLLIRRIDNITRAMMTDSIEYITNPSNDYDAAKIVVERDTDVNRLTFLMFKILKACIRDAEVCKKLGLTQLQVLQFWNLVFLIEKIADETKRIVRIIKLVHSNNIKVNKKELVALYKEIKAAYENIMKAYYKGDIVLSDEIYESKPMLLGQCDKYFQKNKILEVSEITGKFKSIISKTDDISKIIRYLN
ncbi:MAG: hypothetical protein KKF46_02295 [Nanoarchaeota archaeon]|nr:hypothetical protein [Nanoarchaeota archaeon]MBU1321162.1 hypothetical protein [Nanoarchaeota archaeon]MBU1596962.1 hypothetical protein [Nanoarchaeota archaeon]MBU2441520.1 hypothetical protein [Nanoarchaeota archaeon]